MKYYTAEELRGHNRAEAQRMVGEHESKAVRDGFAVEVFLEYHDKLLGLNQRTRTRVLDLGSASGAFLTRLEEAGFRERYAADIDDYLRPGVRETLKGFQLADLSWDKLPWPDGWFDAVTAWCVLPHLENPFHAAREVWRLLRPVGIFIFTTPHLFSKASRDYFSHYGDFRSYRPDNNHISILPPGVLYRTVFRGVNVVGTEYHFRPKVFWGAKGRIRRLVWHMASPTVKKKLAKRWAYNVIYILENTSSKDMPSRAGGAAEQQHSNE